MSGAEQTSLVFLSVKQSAEVLGCSYGALNMRIERGNFPKPFWIGGRRYYTYGILYDFKSRLEAIAGGIGRGKVQEGRRIPEFKIKHENGNILFPKIPYREGGGDNQVTEDQRPVQSRKGHEQNVIRMEPRQKTK